LPHTNENLGHLSNKV